MAEQYRPLSPGPQLVAALFCRDVTYDDMGRIQSIRIVQSFQPSLRTSDDFDEDARAFTDLWFLIVLSNVPDSRGQLHDAESPWPEDMMIGLKAINPNGEEGYAGRLALHPEGPLGVASIQIGWDFPVDQSGVLAVELEYQGRHLTTAFLEVITTPQTGSYGSEGQ